MRGGSADAGHGALDGIGGNHDVAEQGDHDLGAAAVAPALGGGRPALADANAAHTGSLGSSGGVGVDVTGVHPLVHDLQLVHNIRLLEGADHLAVGIIVAHADGAHTAHAQLVIALADDGGDAVLVQQQRRLAGALLDGLDGGSGVSQGVDVGVVRIVFLHILLGPGEVVGHSGILVSRDSVQLAADLAGVQIVLGDQIGDARGLLDELGQVSESAHGHVAGVGAGVGEHDVIGLVGLDDHAAAIAPSAPVHALDINVRADLLLVQIGVGLLGPGVDVGGLAAAHHVPGDGGDFAIGGAGSIRGVRGIRGIGSVSVAGSVGSAGGLVAVSAAAAGQQGQRHDGSEEQSKKFLHFQ